MSTNYRIHLLHDKRIFQRLYISVFLLLIIGNDILHYLLTQGMYEMRMDMADFDNQTSYVKYNSFNVGDEAFKYRVTLHGYSGNVGEILQICVFYHFSAKVWLLFQTIRDSYSILDLITYVSTFHFQPPKMYLSWWTVCPEGYLSFGTNE